MTQTIQTLTEEHDRIRTMLACFEMQLEAFEQARRPDYEILEGSLAYCREYLAPWHHARENALLGLMQRRDPAKARIYEELDEQHVALAQMTRELEKIFEAMRWGRLLLREDLVGHGHGLLRAYHLHLEWEETIFFPAVEKALLPEDWREIATRFDDVMDPLVQNPVDDRYSALFSAIADGQTAKAESSRRA